MAILLGILAATLLAGTWLIRTSLPSAIYTFASTYAPLANGSWFVFGGSNTAGNTTTYFYSSNGSTWSSGTMPTSAVWNVAAANGTRVVALNTAGTGAYTDNGTTWTTFTWAAGSDTTESLIWDGTYFLAPNNNSTASNTLAYSTTGASWSRVAISTNSQANIAYDGSSRYIATRPISTSTGYTCTSNPTGGTGNWSSVTFPSSARWNAVYGNSIWVLNASGQTAYATSTNGTTWTARTFPQTLTAPFSGQVVRPKVGFLNGYFYYYYRSGSTVGFYRSSDGINWTDVSTTYGITATELKAIMSWTSNGGNEAIAVGTGFSGTSDAATTYYLNKTGALS